jgi:hypothetical protein
MSEYGHCELCGLPLVEVDAYGQRLRGCLGCNKWQEVTSATVSAYRKTILLLFADGTLNPKRTFSRRAMPAYVCSVELLV